MLKLVIAYFSYNRKTDRPCLSEKWIEDRRDWSDNIETHRDKHPGTIVLMKFFDNV